MLRYNNIEDLKIENGKIVCHQECTYECTDMTLLAK